MRMCPFGQGDPASVRTSSILKLSPNEEAKRLVVQSINAAYSDVLQREPSADEINESMSVELLTLDGMLQLTKKLLCTPEFLARFALPVSPMLLARILINQIVGRAPASQEEINEIASKIFESGWLACVTQLLDRPAVQQRMASELRGRTQQAKRHRAEPTGTADRATKQTAPEVEPAAAGSRRPGSMNTKTTNEASPGPKEGRSRSAAVARQAGKVPIRAKSPINEKRPATGKTADRSIKPHGSVLEDRRTPHPSIPAKARTTSQRRR